MSQRVYRRIYRKFVYTGLALILIVGGGTLGYWIIGDRQYSVVDCLYMTVITITTIGFGEIIDMSHSPGGRLFTIGIALSGIGLATYILSNITAFLVEGEMTEAFRRRKMENLIKKMADHYVVCGVDGVGFHIIRELSDTGRAHVLVDIDKEKIAKILETYRDEIFIVGDATDNDTLVAAGIEKASGMFAATSDDNRNLVISLTAKQLNPRVRVVARCEDIKNIDKMKKAGADAVVSPTSIGGLRMASEMVRSSVVSFLDTMLRDKEKNLRIEELSVPQTFTGRAIAQLNLGVHRNTLLLAIKREKDWIYNPPQDYELKPGDTMVFMTTPGERLTIETIFR